MTDLNKKNFYNEVVSLLEEVQELYDEYDFDEGDVDDGEEDHLERFINHVRDALALAEENS